MNMGDLVVLKPHGFQFNRSHVRMDARLEQRLRTWAPWRIEFHLGCGCVNIRSLSHADGDESVPEEWLMTLEADPFNV